MLASKCRGNVVRSIAAQSPSTPKHGPLGTKYWLTMMGGSLFFSRLHRNTWNQKLKAARKAAGIDRGTLHSLRHTFISRAANNGTALHLVSKWAGHSDLATTQKYLHTNESYEYLEMDKMLETEKANEKIVSLDEYRKAS